VTIEVGHKSALPPQAQQPAANRAAKRIVVDYAEDVVIEWTRVAARCPHSDSGHVKRWMQSQSIFLTFPINHVIEKSRVMSRNMPDDFINTIFEFNSQARRALDELLGVLGRSETPNLKPEEGALVVKFRNLTASVRPSGDGIVVAMTVPSQKGQLGKVRSAVHKIRPGGGLPPVLIDALTGTGS
jgi:hypothetical protein